MKIEWNKAVWYSWTLAVFVLIGIFFWAGWLGRELRQIDALSQMVKNAELASETAGWKTYSNEEYGFQFKYPSNWNVRNESDASHNLLISFNDSMYGTMDLKDVIFDRPADFDTLEKIYQAMISNREYLPAKDSSAVLKEQNGTDVLIAKKTGFILLSSAPTENILFFKTQSGKIIMLDTYTDDKFTDQIFNSFQQIQSNSATSSDTTNWKTFTDEKYGFEFKYPTKGTVQVRSTDEGGHSIFVNLWTSSEDVVHPDRKEMYIEINPAVSMHPCIDPFRNPDGTITKQLTNINLNGTDFTKGDVSPYTDLSLKSADEYCTVKDGNRYQIIIGQYFFGGTGSAAPTDTALESDDLIKQAISTFKFTN